MYVCYYACNVHMSEIYGLSPLPLCSSLVPFSFIIFIALLIVNLRFSPISFPPAALPHFRSLPFPSLSHPSLGFFSLSLCVCFPDSRSLCYSSFCFPSQLCSKTYLCKVLPLPICSYLPFVFFLLSYLHSSLDCACALFIPLPVYLFHTQFTLHLPLLTLAFTHFTSFCLLLTRLTALDLQPTWFNSSQLNSPQLLVYCSVCAFFFLRFWSSIHLLVASLRRFHHTHSVLLIRFFHSHQFNP